MLQNPLSKESFKKLIKSKIIDYWEINLRAEAAPKPSLLFFKPHFMSLSSPHPMFTTCSTNPFETNKSTCQAALVSGRFKTDLLSRHWIKDNPDGFCVLCPGLMIPGSLDHFMISCSTLMPVRITILNYWYSYSEEDDNLRKLLIIKLRSPMQTLLQFLIDPSVDSDVIWGVQKNLVNLEEIFKLTRSWCYSLNRKKLQITGKFRKI